MCTKSLPVPLWWKQGLLCGVGEHIIKQESTQFKPMLQIFMFYSWLSVGIEVVKVKIPGSRS